MKFYFGSSLRTIYKKLLKTNFLKIYTLWNLFGVVGDMFMLCYTSHMKKKLRWYLMRLEAGQSKFDTSLQVLGIVAGVSIQDHTVRQQEFQQLPYHRIFIMLFIELNAPEHILENINFQVLTAFWWVKLSTSIMLFIELNVPDHILVGKIEYLRWSSVEGTLAKSSRRNFLYIFSSSLKCLLKSQGFNQV